MTAEPAAANPDRLDRWSPWRILAGYATDTLDAIDAALSVLAPLIVLAPGNHAGQECYKLPGYSYVEALTPGAPAPVTVYTIDAPRTVNRGLDREGVSPRHG